MSPWKCTAGTFNFCKHLQVCRDGQLVIKQPACQGNYLVFCKKNKHTKRYPSRYLCVLSDSLLLLLGHKTKLFPVVFVCVCVCAEKAYFIEMLKTLSISLK